jgi:23S rRNA G2069 N7-methylase RlmK/C1962 C5-methylase RlmI
MDALDCAKRLIELGELYDVILLDPPYSYRKSMELYNGHKNSRFKQLLDVLPDILTPPGWVITFGYHSRVMSASRGFRIREICLISHGGAQHDTVATVEERIQVTRGETKDEQ